MAANFSLTNGRLDLWTRNRTDPLLLSTLKENIVIYYVTIPFTYYYHIREPGEGRVKGRLLIEMQETIGASVTKIETLLKARARDENSFSYVFIPECTLSISHVLGKTFLPCSIFNVERRGSRTSKVLLAIVALVADLATLVFRLIAFIPRAIYQRCGNTPPEGIQVIEGNVDWRSGDIFFPTDLNPSNRVRL